MKKSMVLMLIISLFVNVVGAKVENLDQGMLQSDNLLATLPDQKNIDEAALDQNTKRDLSLQKYAQQQQFESESQASESLPAVLDNQVSQETAQPFMLNNTRDIQVEPTVSQSNEFLSSTLDKAVQPVNPEVQVKRVVPAIVKPIAKKAQKASFDQIESEKIG
jgi:hypothetical protein